MWAIPSNSAPAAAFWIIPPQLQPSSSQLPQIWAATAPFLNISAARPVSSFQPGINITTAPFEVQALASPVGTSSTVGAKVVEQSVSTSAPSSSSGGGGGKSKSNKMLRDFSMEVYDKQELQFMGSHKQ